MAPQAVRSETLVDFFHAADQLKDATDAAYGENNERDGPPVREASARVTPRSGGVQRVIRALRYLRRKYPRRERIREVLGYFRRKPQADGLRGRRTAGLPIGSGVVEAACKTLVTECMKRSGMRWREAGGQAILTLRGWAQSDRVVAAWSLLSATYRCDVSVPDEVELAYGRAA